VRPYRCIVYYPFYQDLAGEQDLVDHYCKQIGESGYYN
jgi:hypothetical protein